MGTRPANVVKITWEDERPYVRGEGADIAVSIHQHTRPQSSWSFNRQEVSTVYIIARAIEYYPAENYGAMVFCLYDATPPVAAGTLNGYAPPDGIESE